MMYDVSHVGQYPGAMADESCVDGVLAVGKEEAPVDGAALHVQRSDQLILNNPQVQFDLSSLRCH